MPNSARTSRWWIDTDTIVAVTVNTLEGEPDGGATVTGSLADSTGTEIVGSLTGTARSAHPHIYDVTIPNATALVLDAAYTLTLTVTGSNALISTHKVTRTAGYLAG